MQKNNEYLTADEPVNGIAGGAPVRPQRDRPQPQAGWEEKLQGEKKPERKKGGVTRRAPARGRYIDEYARPQF